MKKCKKVFAFVLALMMAFSAMAMTAAAYGEEEHVHTDACSAETIMPRKPSAICAGCGQGMEEFAIGTDINGNRYVTLRCENPNCPNPGLVVVSW